MQLFNINDFFFISDCVEDSEDDNLNDNSGLTAIIAELETVGGKNWPIFFFLQKNFHTFIFNSAVYLNHLCHLF